MLLFTTPDIASSPLTSVFKFHAGSTPCSRLLFPKPAKSSRSRKRSRALADVDEHSTQSKKKRRLRLLLITSRLSHPFSTPATHIVDRGPSKIAVWAKEKRLLPQALRKAAIMNRVRRRTLEREAWLRKDSGISVDEDEKAGVRKTVLDDLKMEGPNAFGKASLVRSIVEHLPTPSPLGLSNYDAFDDEDAYYGDEYEDEHQYCGMCPNSADEGKLTDLQTEQNGYYSDFNFFDSSNEDGRDSDDEYDDPFSLSVLPDGIGGERRPPSPPETRTAELMKEEARERKVLFLEFVPCI